MSHEAIAIVLGVSRNTLEKHFSHELTVGAYERRMEAMQGLHAAAKKGNVSAVKTYLAALPQFMPPPAEHGAVAPPVAPEKAAQPVGKKEAAAAAAKVAQQGTGWEDILPAPASLQ